MKKSEFKNFSTVLIAWFDENSRELPWRESQDPYKIWISEIMLQQTTVNAVIPYYKNWIEKFPQVKDVARAPQQKILKSWQGLGYYQRARNIHETSKIIVKRYSGRFPEQREILKTLPGFGPYTIGAVLSIAFDQRIPAIDGNVRRVVSRLLCLPGKLNSKMNVTIENFLGTVMPESGNRIFNQAIMELGAMVCTPRSPSCLKCPVQPFCRAYREGKQEIIPAPKKIVIQEIDVAIAVIEHEDQFFIQRRSKRGLFADLWEFPGGKIEKGETPKEALVREIREELGVSIVSARHFMNTSHSYTQFKANLHVWICKVNPLPSADRMHKWVYSDGFAVFPMPSGSAKIAERLLAQYSLDK